MLKETAAVLGNTVVSFIQEQGPKLAAVVAILTIGLYLAKRLHRFLGLLLQRGHVDETLTGFLQDLGYYIALVLILVTAADQAGVPTTSLVAILGTAGLAIGLALKDHLSNVAAGVILFINRPFRLGDVVEIAGTRGKITNISIFITTLKSPDNKKIFVPNGKIFNGSITNITANPQRRLDLTIGVGYQDDIIKVKRILNEVLQAEDKVLDNPTPTIGVGDFGDSSVNFLVRPWVKSSDFLAAKMSLLENIKIAFDREGISIPYPQRDLHIIHGSKQDIS